jgi:hypothetical protein
MDDETDPLKIIERISQRYDETHLAKLQKGSKEWNAWREQERSVIPNLRKAPLAGAQLSDCNLSRADLAYADLREAILVTSNLTNTMLNGADLTNARLFNAQLEAADLTGATLRGAILQGAQMERANLAHADLRDADLSRAWLESTEWSDTKLGNTSLDRITFGGKHRSMHDGTHLLRLMGRDRWMNWGKLRGIGALPLFGASYIAFGAALLLVQTIAFLNQYTGLSLGIPERTRLLLISSVLLMIGTTIHKLFCPERVQTFSLTEWVEEHRHPRLLYLAESLKRRGQIPAAALTLAGGVLAGGLLLDRLYAAAKVLWPQLFPFTLPL